MSAEEVLTAELAGWVQQMNDAMRDLKNHQDGAAGQATKAPGQAGRAIEPSADASQKPPPV